MLDVLVLLAVLPPWLILSPVVMENEIKYEVVFISPPVHITTADDVHYHRWFQKEAMVIDCHRRFILNRRCWVFAMTVSVVVTGGYALNYPIYAL